MTASRGRLSTVPRPITWDRAHPAPLVLVTGPEELLQERAVERVVELSREADPEVEVVRLDASDYTAGRLTVAASPSLFGEPRVVVLERLEAGVDAAYADLAAYVAAPEADVVVVLVHGGGNRGKPTIEAVKAADAVQVTCDAIKRDADKTAFAADEIRRAGRQAEPAAVQALVEAVGADLRELAAACRQLVADTSGRISVAVVDSYYGGRVEATGFRVADAAVEGKAGEAVALLRHALASGTDPVPMVAALAARLRVLAKVGAARGRGLTAQDLGLAPWQMDRAKRELSSWRPETLAAAIAAVARADAEVKGAGRDPVFAVERAVLRVAAAARG